MKFHHLAAGISAATLFLTPATTRAQVLAEETALNVREEFRKEIDTRGKRSPQGKVYLKLAARLECTWKNGSQPGMDIFINKIPLSGERLVNKPTTYPFGEYDVLWSRGDGRWSVPYYDWNIGNPPQKYIHLYVFDITDLLLDEKADIRIVDIFSAFPNSTLMLRDVEVSYKDDFPTVERGETAFRKPLSELRRRATGYHPGAAVTLSLEDEFRPQLDGPKTLKRDYSQPYKVSVAENGKIIFSIQGEEYSLHSEFGFPELGWLDLEKPGGWKRQAEEKLVHETRLARIERTIHRYPSYLEIRDRVINRTRQDLPVGILNALDVNDLGSLTSFRLCGKAMPTFWANSEPAVGKITPMLPLAFVGRKTSGVGLWLQDDAYRNQASFLVEGSRLYAGTECFYLEPEKEYTFCWRLYPVAKPSYFEVLNAHRHAEQLYQEIPGLLGFVYPDQRVDSHLTTPEAVAQFFEKTGITVAGMINAEEIVHKPKFRQYMVYGNETVDRIAKSAESALRVRELAREAKVPGVKYIMYTDIHLLNNRHEEQWLENLKDSIIRDDKGRLVPFSAGFLYCVLPREGSSSAKRVEEAIDWYLDEAKFDGIFFDEWPRSRAERSFAPGHEDGFSALIDHDFKIRRKFGHVALLSKSFQERLVKGIKQRHPEAILYANHFDVTQAAAQWPIVHFAEPTQHDDDFLRAAQAGRTPLALNTKYTKTLWEDVTAFLKHGVLMTYYSKRFEGDHLLKHIYPITVRETGPGYVIGDGKIVTCVSGTYHFGRSRPLKAKIFQGPKAAFIRDVDGRKEEGISRVDLNLTGDEVAVIFEADAP